MAQNIFCTLTPEQRELYMVQPDVLPSFQRSLEGELEFSQYAKDSSCRFWLNCQPASYANHWHTAVEILMPLENIYTITVQHTDYVLNPGDILVIPTGVVHSITTPETGCRFVYMFELDLFSKIPGFNYILSLMTQPILITPEEDPAFYEAEASLIRELATYYWSDEITKELNIFAGLLRFFAKIGENNISTAPPSISTSSKTGSLVNRLSMVLDYLDTHYSESITLEEAASIACFSKFYFTRLFKQYTNQTFYDYLSTKRIKAAEQMLIVPNLAITEISLKSGFSSLSSFNRTFKRLKGCSPSEYRSLYSLVQQPPKK